MTNFIKRLLSAVTLLGVVSVTPAFAIECHDFKVFAEGLVGKTGVPPIKLTDQQLSNIFSKKKLPEDTVSEDENIEGYLFPNAEGSMEYFVVVQGNCARTGLGPLPTPIFNELMGITQAGSGSI